MSLLLLFGGTTLSLTGDYPDAVLGEAYSFTPTTTGGAGPYTYTLVAGSLPTGLSLNASTGEVSGVASEYISIPSLFTGGQEGLWFDPQDLTSMTLNAGFTGNPASVGQPVGTAMDKRLSSTWVSIPMGDLIFTKVAGVGVLSVNGNQVTVTGSDAAGTEILITNNNAHGMGTIGAWGTKTLKGLVRARYTATFTGSPTLRLWMRGAPHNPTTSGLAHDVIVTQSQGDYDAITVTSGTATFTFQGVEFWRGNHLEQGTGAKKPILRQDGNGKNYLEFDAFDDFLSSTFTVAQPFDRVSAISHINANAQIFGGLTANAGVLYESAGAFNLFDGTQLSGPPWGTLTAYVISERHNGASSRLARDNEAYTTGNSGTTLPGGITLNQQNGGTGSASSARQYGFVMRSGAFTDTEVGQLRTLLGLNIGKAL